MGDRDQLENKRRRSVLAASNNATGHFLTPTRMEPQKPRNHKLKDKGRWNLLDQYNFAPKANLVAKTNAVEKSIEINILNISLVINVTKNYP